MTPNNTFNELRGQIKLKLIVQTLLVDALDPRGQVIVLVKVELHHFEVANVVAGKLNLIEQLPQLSY